MQQGFLSWLASRISELLSRLPLPEALKSPIMFVMFIGVLVSLVVFLYSLASYLKARRAVTMAKERELPPPPRAPGAPPPPKPEPSPSLLSEVLSGEPKATKVGVGEELIGGDREVVGELGMGERSTSPSELDIEELSKRLSELKRELESMAEQPPPPSPEKPVSELPPPPPPSAPAPSEEPLPVAREPEKPAEAEKPPELAPVEARFEQVLKEAEPEPAVAEARAEAPKEPGYVKAKIRALEAALKELERLRAAGEVGSESYNSLRDEISSQIELLRKDLEAIEKRRRLEELMRKREEYAAKLKEIEEEIRRIQSTL